MYQGRSTLCLDVGDTLIALVECGGVLWQGYDDQVWGVFAEVLDQSGDAIGIDGF